MTPVSTYLDFEAAINGEFLHAGGREASRRLLSLVDLRPDMRVLEIGCGSGATLSNLSEMGQPHLFAVDLSLKMLKNTAKRFRPRQRARLILADAARALPFSPHSFDLLYAESVAGILEFSKILPEWNRVLKKGGQLALNDGLWKPGTTTSTVNKFTHLARQEFGHTMAPENPETGADWNRLLRENGFVKINMVNAAHPHDVLGRTNQDIGARRFRILSHPQLWRRYFRYRKAVGNFAELGQHLNYWLFLARKQV